MKQRIGRDVDPDDNYYNNLFPCVDRCLRSDKLSLLEGGHGGGLEGGHGGGLEGGHGDGLEGGHGGWLEGGHGGLFILSLNILSLRANLCRLEKMLDSVTMQPDVIMLTETWLSELTTSYYNIKGYNVHHTVLVDTEGVGECLFISQNH